MLYFLRYADFGYILHLCIKTFVLALVLLLELALAPVLVLGRALVRVLALYS